MASACSDTDVGAGPTAVVTDTTLDFNFRIGRSGIDCVKYVERGYRLTTSAYNFFSTAVRINDFVLGATGVAFPNFGFALQSLTLSRDDNRPFTLVSVSATEFFTVSAPVRLNITAAKADSSRGHSAIALDGIRGPEQFDITGFEDVRSVTFGGPGTGSSDLIVLDNIRVSSPVLRGRIAATLCEEVPNPYPL
jgi:hypothetical protein